MASNINGRAYYLYAHEKWDKEHRLGQSGSEQGQMAGSIKCREFPD
jgi:hypothetical protein